MGGLRADVNEDLCFSFGRCMDIAPAVFEWSDTGLSVGGRVDPSMHAAAIRAAESCPRFAITLSEIDGEADVD